MDNDVWMTLKEAAHFTGVGVQTVYSWLRRGHLTVTSRRGLRRGRPTYSAPATSDAPTSIKACSNSPAGSSASDGF